jgi:predicted Zn-dependent peptidase
VESRAFGGWMQGLKQSIEARKLQPAGLLSETIDGAFYPASEVRRRPLEYAQVRRLKSEMAQARIREIAAGRAAEVAVVGDIDRDAAVSLVAKYFGALPARPRISADTLSSLRGIARPKGPIAVARTVEGLRSTLIPRSAPARAGARSLP